MVVNLASLPSSACARLPQSPADLLCPSGHAPRAAARSKHKVECVPKRNMDDVMGLSMGSFAEDEACSGVKSTVRQWRDDHAGVLELVRYATSAACLSLSGLRQRMLASTARRVRPSSWPRSSVLCRRLRSLKSGPKSSCTH